MLWSSDDNYAFSQIKVKMQLDQEKEVVIVMKMMLRLIQRIESMMAVAFFPKESSN